MTDPIYDRDQLSDLLTQVSEAARHYLAPSTSVRRSMRGKVAFRPAIANWRTTERDVEIILRVVRGLAER